MLLDRNANDMNLEVAVFLVVNFGWKPQDRKFDWQIMVNRFFTIPAFHIETWQGTRMMKKRTTKT
jgi:hypothetical protein